MNQIILLRQTLKPLLRWQGVRLIAITKTNERRLFRTCHIKLMSENRERVTGNSVYFSSFLIREIIIRLSSCSQQIINSISFISHNPTL